MHDLYARHNVKQLQKEMFRKSHFPRVMMNPQEANYAYLRGEVELVSCATRKAALPLKAPCLIRLGCCALSRAKSGAAPCCATLPRWKTVSTCYQASRLSCRAYTLKSVRVANRFAVTSSNNPLLSPRC